MHGIFEGRAVARSIWTLSALLALAGCSGSAPDDRASAGTAPQAGGTASQLSAALLGPPAPTKSMITAARANSAMSVNFRGAGTLEPGFLSVVQVEPISVTEVPYPDRKRYEVSGNTTLALTTTGDAVLRYLATQAAAMDGNGRNGMTKAATRAALGFQADQIRTWSRGDTETYPDRFIIEWCGDSWMTIDRDCSTSRLGEADVSKWEQPTAEEVEAEQVAEQQRVAAEREAEQKRPVSPPKFLDAEHTAQFAYISANRSGEVTFWTHIDDRGRPAGGCNAENHGTYTDQVCVDLAKWRFEPALNAAGQAVWSTVSMAVTFDGSGTAKIEIRNWQ